MHKANNINEGKKEVMQFGDEGRKIKRRKKSQLSFVVVVVVEKHTKVERNNRMGKPKQGTAERLGEAGVLIMPEFLVLNV